jgi:hypothetical protein
MDQLDTVTYRVAKNEEITIEFTAFGVGELVAFVSAGMKPGQPQPKSPPTYNFTIIRKKFQAGNMQCTFPPDTKNSAKYETRLRGSVGNTNWHTGPTIKKTDAIHDPELTFLVAK